MATNESEFDLDQFLKQAGWTLMLLDQDQYWYDAKGQRRAIESMSVRYKANVLAFCRRRAKHLGTMYLWGMVGRLTEPVYREVLGELGGETIYSGRTFSEADLMSNAVNDDFDRWFNDQLRRDPEEWLDSTPLIKRLSADVLASVGGMDGD